MKKNTVLYILLLVLIIMNAFFLFNYLGRPDHRGPKESSDFIVSELKFNDKQLKQFNDLEDTHHNNMRTIGDDIKFDKDQLFGKITAPEIDQNTIDSLIASISNKEILKEKELFNRLRGIYQLCDDNQKKRFNDIIKKARNFNPQGPKRPMKPK